MSLLFQWIEHSWLGISVNNSLWAFAAFEAAHLLALAVIGGAVLVVDLRTLGWVFPRQRVADIAGEARPWLVGQRRRDVPDRDSADGLARVLEVLLQRGVPPEDVLPRCGAALHVPRSPTSRDGRRCRARTRGWRRRWRSCRCCCGPASASWAAASGSIKPIGLITLWALGSYVSVLASARSASDPPPRAAPLAW